MKACKYDSASAAVRDGKHDDAADGVEPSEIGLVDELAVGIVVGAELDLEK